MNHKHLFITFVGIKAGKFADTSGIKIIPIKFLYLRKKRPT